jgi:hypothetical protein
MQCRYCVAETPDSGRECVLCNTSQSVAGAPKKFGERNGKRAAPGNFPALCHLQFSTRFRMEQYWRTRHLTGSMSPTPPTDSANDAATTASGSFDFSVQQNHPAVQAMCTERAGISRSSAERTEPHFNDVPIPPFADPGHGGQHSYSSFSRDTGALPQRAISRIAIMLGIFVFGAAVGLAAAWWINRAGPVPHVSALQHSGAARSEGTVQQPAPDGHRVAVRGISPGELPYDGAPPRPIEPVEQAPKASASEPPLPALSLTNEMRDAAEDAQPVEPIKSPPEAKASEQANSTPIETKVTKKRRTAPRITKDREIERIKQQANDELKKKFEIGLPVGERRARKQQASSPGNRPQVAITPRESKENHVRKILAQCERSSNLFRREQCKWQLCSGMWGQDGCPSYSKHVSVY